MPQVSRIGFRQTNAGDVHPKFGAVYKVEGSPLFPDLGLGDDHCCNTIHGNIDWCAFRSYDLTVTEVAYFEVYAATGYGPFNRPHDFAGQLKNAYAEWRERHGYDWWEV